MSVPTFCAKVLNVVRDERDGIAEAVIHGRSKDWEDYRANVRTMEALDALEEQIRDLLRDYLNEDEE